MSQNFDCVLTLAVPTALEEEVLDYLSSRPECVEGFSLSRQEGFGKGATLLSAMEKVRGRARRSVITILMRRDAADALIATLKKEFPTGDASWWLSPLLDFGRFA